MQEINQEGFTELLAKQMAGETSALENTRIEQWISLSQENKIFANQLMKLWENSGDSNLFDDKTEIALDKVKNNIKQIPVPVLKINYLKWTMASAAIISIFILAYFLFKPGENIENKLTFSSGIQIETQNHKLQTFLPDSTLVILEPNSRLVADSFFGKTHRNVILHGQAYFKTMHGKSFHFSVQAADLLIEDVGTAFTVNYNQKKVIVSVQEGIVIIRSEKDSLKMFRDDSAIYSENKIRSVVSKLKRQEIEIPKDVKDKILEFDRTELEKVVEVLNTTYQSHIKIGSDRIARCKVVGRFKNENLNTILEVLRETFNLEIRHEGIWIILDGKGCQ